ncbi:purine nucleosidase/pyrimidine-specific ribonucleoside hydrolase [Nocardioides luteus]|uniref:Pyrimidine-specific ribonucleoside hydrolase RihA n=1 Tax=Nocardioides luteus TaxID=1844 RepID=A0ABQ5SSH9_9ACTN|nr:nucleoside hydrolase [Nocardioides luteus]MDR7311013.1 purine nucleosidase/pyrimidine-specific ribonucleoside hydrolase [Nocardioides luteus]GGR67578.1 pyrimidine-specific ribonucleoside hydrolase RihA [Nocardioides luteus]GLJ66558.1 pyrimidine-specific ribonucleoside hydrolase RihA [Nocardioides luteus]
MNPVPVLLDCDPGHDDAIAILLALGSPAIELLGITTTFGNCPVDQATYNAQRILALAQRPDVPIAAGAAGPLAGEAHIGDFIHGRTGIDGPDLPAPLAPPVRLGAVEFLRTSLLDAPDPVTLVATGPMTNVGMLLRDHPDVGPKIAEIVFMGGSTERGNTTPAAEFNAYADPDALDLVLTSGLPVRMVGLNLSHQALATPDVVERMRAMDHAVGRACADLMGFFGGTYSEVFDFAAPPVHDPCTIAALIDPGLITWRRSFVAVETEGRWTRGATVVDLHGRLDEPANADVALTIDAPGYWDLVLAALDRVGSQPAER